MEKMLLLFPPKIACIIITQIFMSLGPDFHFVNRLKAELLQ